MLVDLRFLKRSWRGWGAPLVASIAFALTACDGAVTDAPQSDGSESLSTGPLTISTALTFNTAVVAQGQVLQGTVTYKNPTSSPVTIKAFVITARPPGGTHNGGPFDDFVAPAKNITLGAGQTYTVQSSRTFLSTDLIGTWDGYSTYQDSTGWHDGPDLYFTVVGPSGGVVISSAMSLSSTSLITGQTLNAQVSYQNLSSSAVTLQSITVAGRPPGGTHSGGPFDNLAPALGATPLAPGQTVTLASLRTFTAADPAGSWEVYPSYQDGSGSHDGPSTFVGLTYNGMHAAYPNAFVNSAGVPVVVRGFNVRNVVYPSTNWTYSEANFATVKAAGFNVLRFALNWPDFEPTNGGFNATAFTLLGEAVANAKAAGIYVVLDPNHLKGGGTNTPSWATGSDSIAITQSYAGPYLQKIAAQFQAEPTVIAIDLTNEPWQKALNQSRTFQMYQTLIQAVRQVNVNTTLIIEPTWGNSQYSASDLSAITNTTNLVMSLHDYYAGGNATGYDSTGVPAGDFTWDGTSGYPSPNIGELNTNVEVNLNVLAPLNIPLFVGEYGIGDAATNQQQWLIDITSVLDQHNLPRTLWEWHSGGSMSATNTNYTYAPWVPLLLQ